MKNALTFYLALVTTLLFTGCATTIPETDTTPPEIRFEITIPGHGTVVVTSDEEIPFLNVNIPENTRCTFRYTASDQGGLRFMQMQYDSHLELSGLASVFTIRTLSPLSNMLEWSGDRDNPTTGTVAAGAMKTPVLEDTDGISGSIRFFASDFGGRSGTPNDTRMEFVLSVVDDRQPIGRLD
jgi:hypothetical protein